MSYGAPQLPDGARTFSRRGRRIPGTECEAGRDRGARDAGDHALGWCELIGRSVRLRLRAVAGESVPRCDRLPGSAHAPGSIFLRHSGGRRALCRIADADMDRPRTVAFLL